SFRLFAGALIVLVPPLRLAMSNVVYLDAGGSLNRMNASEEDLNPSNAASCARVVAVLSWARTGMDEGRTTHRYSFRECGHGIAMSQPARCVVSGSILPDIYFTCH